MRRTAFLLLQAVILLFGLAALALLLWEPWIEGRNAHATSAFDVYLGDSFLVGVYIGSIPFFVGVWQASTLAALCGQGRLASPEGVRAARIVKFCAMAIVGFVALGEIVIFRDSSSDDRAGGVAMGVMIGVASIAVASIAAFTERALRGSAGGAGITPAA